MAFSQQTAEDLLVKSGRRCALCHEFKGTKMEIHHIEAVKDGGADDPDNLIPLCLDCHADVSSYNEGHPKGRKYRPAELKKHRDQWFVHVAAGHVPMSNLPSSVSIQGDHNIAAGRDMHITNVHRSRKSSPAPVLPGTVSCDPRMIGYLQYLARRYTDFKSWECKKAGKKLNGGFIHGAYLRELKYSLRNTPVEMFPRAVEYLQSRINQTKLARMQKGQRLFSPFEEFDADKSDRIPVESDL